MNERLIPTKIVAAGIFFVLILVVISISAQGLEKSALMKNVREKAELQKDVPVKQHSLKKAGNYWMEFLQEKNK